MKKNPIYLVVILVAVLMMLAAACSLPGKTSGDEEAALPTEPASAATIPTLPAAEPTPLQPSETPQFPFETSEIYPAAFAGYPNPQVRLPAEYSGGYSLPVDLNQVQISETITLSPEQRQLLSQNGFVVAAPTGEFQEFYQVYESVRYEYDVPVFATTDSVFHIYHLIFDKLLRDLERQYFIPNLEELTTALFQASLEQYQALSGTILEQAALRNLAFFGVAGRLLELPLEIPGQAAALVDEEVALINAQGGLNVSPIWAPVDGNEKDLVEDYSQYIPRGHYTRSEELKRYFKTMMWYGRMTYRLNSDFETRRALLMTQLLRSTTSADGRTAQDLWEAIYDPTVFIVGKSDDLSFYEYGAISDKIFGKDPDPLSFSDGVLFAEFKEAAKALPPPKVNSMFVLITEDKEQVTKGFRFMGQRFTLDAYVFGQMIWRNVGTTDNPRGLPKGLDFFASLGSQEALNLLDTMGESDYPNFSTQMDKVQGEVAQLEQEDWTQNLYWAWLYAFHPLIEAKDNRYPPFMRNTAWTHKDLQTALGSWTELKHDTILYAKQVMAELGGGGPEEPVRGWVEPNPEAYARLKALAQMTYDGLQQRDMLMLYPQIEANLTNLITLLEFMQRMAEQELAGETISDEDYFTLMYYGGQLERMTLAAADTEDEFSRDLEDQKAALIADVATGPVGGINAGDLRVLEEAIGQPTRIYVVLPDEPWRVAVGAVFTYYEFHVGLDERMTDEQWQAMLESGEAPPQPEWTSSFIAP